jgi:hypothetical protein
MTRLCHFSERLKLAESWLPDILAQPMYLVDAQQSIETAAFGNLYRSVHRLFCSEILAEVFTAVEA